MDNIIKKCIKPSKEKYKFIIFILLFMLGVMIYLGYNLYDNKNYKKSFRKKIIL